MATINKEHEGYLFNFLFGRKSNKKWTLGLYNALNQTNYTDPDEIEFAAIEDAVCMGAKDKFSFTLCRNMNAYEPKITYSPIAPMQQLMYAVMVYEKYIEKNGFDIYGTKQIKLPAPKLVALYNDEGSGASSKEMEVNEGSIFARIRLFNINYKKNGNVLNACRPLKEYAWLIDQIQENLKHVGIREAVDKAIGDIPADFETRSFLVEHKTEGADICVTEYNEAEKS